MILIVFRLWWLRTALFSFIKSATNTHKRTHSEAHRSDVINRAIQSLPGFVTKESSNEWEQDNPPQSSSPSFFVQEAVGTAANQHFNLASWHYQFTDRLDSFCALSGIQFYLNVSRPSLCLFGIFLPDEWNSLSLFNCLSVHFLDLFFAALQNNCCCAPSY